MHVRSQDGRNCRRDQTTGVNREIEHREERRQLQGLLGQFELIAAERRYARFDPPAT